MAESDCSGTEQDTGAIGRAKRVLEELGLDNITEVEEGTLYEVKVVNHAETDHFHNSLFVEMQEVGLFPLHVEFEKQEVEFTDVQ